MNLAPFIKKQESDKPFMCINEDHAMPLVARINLDDEIELKCFVGHCDYRLKPGLSMYDQILKEFPHE